MYKMATPVHKSFCVLQLSKFCSILTVQWAFRRRFGMNPPTDKSIRWRYRQFETTGCICKEKSPGRPRVPNERIENVRAAFIRKSRKSVRHASRELEMPPTAMWRVLWKGLHMRPYCLQLLRSLHGRLARWRKWRACDVGEAKEGLENELWRRWSNGKVGEWAVT